MMTDKLKNFFDNFGTIQLLLISLNVGKTVQNLDTEYFLTLKLLQN